MKVILFIITTINKMTDDNNSNSWSAFRLVENFCDQSAIIASQKEEIAELKNLVKAASEGFADACYGRGLDFLCEIMPKQNIFPYCVDCYRMWDEKLTHICKCGKTLCDKCVSENGPDCCSCLRQFETF